MNIANHLLSYCSNIHPGETWHDTFESLKTYIPNVKKAVSPEQAFGIGLRLSNQASLALESGNNLEEFKKWLEEKRWHYGDGRVKCNW